MHNAKTVVVVLLVAVAVAVGLLFNLSDAGPAPALSGSPEGPGAPATPMTAALQAGSAAFAMDASARAVVEGSAEIDPDLDPSIQAALAGFRGRVVDHAGAPQPGLVVALYRVATDAILHPGAAAGDDHARGDVGADAVGGQIEPEIDAGQATTREQGEFAINGVWPQGLYLLIAGVGAEVSRMLIVDHTPGPGEIVDLGDIRLDHAATLVGRVVDDEGLPLAGAMVRALDIPGAIAALLPVESFDPAGVLIVTQASEGLVIEFPAWFGRRFEQLPIPRTMSVADGTFRLTGVPAGNVMVAATVANRQSNVLPRVKLDAGDERDLGDLRLKEGEEAWGKVLDSAGKPIVGAQVVVGQVLGMAPFAFGRHAELTDERGEFSLAGFGGGKVIAAARRAAGDPWVVGESTPVAQDLLVRLPSTFRLTVQVASSGGEPVEGARLRLVPCAEEEMQTMALFGFGAAVPLEDRLVATEPGQYIIDPLAAGKYFVEVDAPGYEVGSQSVDVQRDMDCKLQLAPVSVCRVLVVTADAEPIRAASVYAAKEDMPHNEIPVSCGRTDGDGRIEVRSMAAGEISLSVYHPGFGWATAAARLPATEEVVVVLEAPGALRGVATDRGRPPQHGKWMVVVSRSDGEMNDLAVPRLAAPDPKGEFEVRGLQPGRYSISGVPSVRAIKSIGSIFMMGQRAMFTVGGRDQEFVIRPGAVATARIEFQPEPEVVEGPAARLAGTVMVNGKPAVGMTVMTWSRGRRSAVVDATGRFDLGRLSAGNVTLNVLDTDDPMAMFDFAMWRREVDLVADQDLDVTVDITFGGVVGLAFQPDGSPAARCVVQLKGTAGEGRMELTGTTDAAGVFRVNRVPAGSYLIKVDGARGRAEVADVEVHAGAPTTGVEVRLRRTYTVRGTVDVSAFGGAEHRWMWVRFEGAEPASGQNGSDTASGGEHTFEVTGLMPGTYHVEVQAFFPKPTAEEEWSGDHREFVHQGTIEIVDHDLTGLVLRPVPKSEEKTPTKASGGG